MSWLGAMSRLYRALSAALGPREFSLAGSIAQAIAVPAHPTGPLGLAWDVDLVEQLP